MQGRGSCSTLVGMKYVTAATKIGFLLCLMSAAYYGFAVTERFRAETRAHIEVDQIVISVVREVAKGCPPVEAPEVEPEERDAFDKELP